MKAIKEYFQRRRTRKLAERILSHQIAYTDSRLRDAMVRDSILTAERFQQAWRTRK